MSLVLVALLWIVPGCGGDKASRSGEGEASVEAPYAQWMSSPEGVIQGVMHAYDARDDTLYAALLADDFRYEFVPPGADSSEILTWGREEEVSATGSLFRTAELEKVTLMLRYGEAAPAAGNRMMVPVSGGELRLDVKEKETTVVHLNRQEIFLSPHPQNATYWQIVAWHDYPSPE